VKRYDLAKAAVERVVKDGVDAELVTAFTVANNEMPWYYSAADAMLLCSDREVSRPRLRGSATCNLPVVATNVGDVPRDHEAGLQETLRSVRRTLVHSLLVFGKGAFLTYREESGFRRTRGDDEEYDQASTMKKIIECV
jgi:hypothetical protein